MLVLIYASVRLSMARVDRHESNLTLENVEALTNDNENENNRKYHLCYYESKVKVGYTYYDCGSCSKVYNEKGKGAITKCFY